MTQGYVKTLIITSWTAMMLVTAIFVGVESATEWTVIAGASMLPPLIMLRTWGRPAVTISQSIRQAFSDRSARTGRGSEPRSMVCQVLQANLR